MTTIQQTIAKADAEKARRDARDEMIAKVWDALSGLPAAELYDTLRELGTLDYSHSKSNGESVWKISRHAIERVAVADPKWGDDFTAYATKIDATLKEAGWSKQRSGYGWNIPSSGDVRARFVRGVEALRAL